MLRVVPVTSMPPCPGLGCLGAPLGHAQDSGRASWVPWAIARRQLQRIPLRLALPAAGGSDTGPLPSWCLQGGPEVPGPVRSLHWGHQQPRKSSCHCFQSPSSGPLNPTRAVGRGFLWGLGVGPLGTTHASPLRAVDGILPQSEHVMDRWMDRWTKLAGWKAVPGRSQGEGGEEGCRL